MLNFMSVYDFVPNSMRKVRGHYSYFRGIGNTSSLWIYYREVVKLLYKWLNRRSQRRSLTWERINQVLVSYGFPTPNQPNRVDTNRGACVKTCDSVRVSVTEESGAGNLRAGISAGGVV
jgi:hypothetical protein